MCKASIFLAMKNCLQNFQYPNIELMDDTEILKLFNAPNRVFLVSWIIKKISSEFEFEGATQKDTEAALADLICAHGFCSKKEKVDFINGELEPSKSVMILHRMLAFMQDINEKYDTDTKSSNLTFDDIMGLKNMDLNLFPEYGPLSISSEEQKIKKIEELTAELQVLKEQVQYKKPIEEVQEHISKNSLQDLEKSLQELKRTMPIVNFEYINKFLKVKTVKNDVKFTVEHGEILRKFNETLKKLKEFQDNMNVIEDFENAHNAAMSNTLEPLNENISKLLELMSVDNLDIEELPNLL